jgi:hypothetical protein
MTEHGGVEVKFFLVSSWLQECKIRFRRQLQKSLGALAEQAQKADFSHFISFRPGILSLARIMQQPKSHWSDFL